MKIGPPPDAIQAEVVARLNERTRSGGPAAVTEVQPTDRVELSRPGAAYTADAANARDQDVDTRKVEALRQAIAEERYQVRAEVVADRMIAQAADLLHTIAFGKREQP